MPCAFAARTGQAIGFSQGRPQPLARHLKQPKARDASDLDTCPVGLQGLGELGFDGALIACRGHVDEIDDDKAAKVANPQLAGDLFGRLEIGIERGLLDVAAAGRAGRVHIDGDECLGVIEDDGAARFKAHLARKRRFDLVFDLVARE